MQCMLCMFSGGAVWSGQRVPVQRRDIQWSAGVQELEASQSVVCLWAEPTAWGNGRQSQRRRSRYEQTVTSISVDWWIYTVIWFYVNIQRPLIMPKTSTLQCCIYCFFKHFLIEKSDLTLKPPVTFCGGVNMARAYLESVASPTHGAKFFNVYKVWGCSMQIEV